MSDHDDHHHHDHDHSELSETELRVRALETILTEKGYVDPAALDAIIQAYETKIGPHNGAEVVAKAWTDPAFRQALAGIFPKSPFLRRTLRLHKYLMQSKRKRDTHSFGRNHG